MSKIEVNTVDVQCGSTLTLGSSGKTVTLATGASQSGFGRTGTVDWCTTAKTSPFTAVSGDGFFINTTGGAITVTLPSSPSAGDIVAFKDYGNTWGCNEVTVCSNGWIGFGSLDLESFRNYPIPGTGGPSPMVAVFWDDLEDGDVYAFYDESNDRFIIEWYNFDTYLENSNEEFPPRLSK